MPSNHDLCQIRKQLAVRKPPQDCVGRIKGTGLGWPLCWLAALPPHQRPMQRPVGETVGGEIDTSKELRCDAAGAPSILALLVVGGVNIAVCYFVARPV